MDYYPKRTFRERVADFMRDRNGPDALYTCVIVLYLLTFFVGLFFPRQAIFSVAEFVLIGYAIFRLLSKNIYKRQEENRRFLALIRRVSSFFKNGVSAFRERKTHVFRRCPRCRNTLRLPRRPGEHTVCCPCCGERFGVKVR